MRVYPKRKGERITTNIPAASLRNEHFKADSITANEIAADTITANEISADYIEVGGATADINSDEGLDGINNGILYGKVGKTDISGGHIKLHSDTVVDGEWYDSSGVEIDADSGINIYGTDSALTTRATKTGDIQCKVDSSGRITAGEDTVLLSDWGITVKGEKLRLQDSSGGNTAYLEVGASGNLELNAYSTSDVYCNSDLLVRGAVVPETDSTYDIGYYATRFANGYFDAIITTGAAISGILAIPVKTTTGDQASPSEGQLYVNTYDNKIRCYADSAWRDLATW